MRRVAGLALAVMMSGTASASAEELTVGMPARTFVPPNLTVVVGDTVSWSNSSNENHDVTAESGAFASGGVGPGGRFTWAAKEAGPQPYVCAIHRTTMQGRLDVVPVALGGPPAPITPGESAVLTGRAPAGTAEVAIEEIGSDGDARGIATLRADPAGRFQIAVRPSQSVAYRAVAAGGASPPLTVAVVDRVKIVVAASRGRHVVRLRVRTDPARPGDTVALQLYSRERFSWRQVKHGTLDPRGRVELSLPRKVRRLARVVLVREGRTAGRSAPLMTWRAGRVAPRRSPHGHH